MQEDFSKALPFVLQAEGGYSDTPGDNGGATNKGIEQGEYNVWLAARGLPPADIRDITDGQASEVYNANYWAPVHGDWVSFPLCTVLFDSAVNCGVGKALAWLNQALGQEPVGQWQECTSSAYHALDADGARAVADQVLLFRHTFYVDLAAAEQHDEQFLNGWLNRITALKQACGLAE